MKWTNGEQGPDCSCGFPTVVSVDEKNGQVNLVCFLHTKEAGVVYPLPRDNRPDQWPNLNDEEMIALTTVGMAEQDEENAKAKVFADKSQLN